MSSHNDNDLTRNTLSSNEDSTQYIKSSQKSRKSLSHIRQKSTPKDILRTKKDSSSYDFDKNISPIENNMKLSYKLSKSNTSTIKTSPRDKSHRSSSRDSLRSSSLPIISLGSTESNNIILWDVVSKKHILLELNGFNDIKSLLKEAKQKFKTPYSFKHIHHRKKNIKIESIEEINAADELKLTPGDDDLRILLENQDAESNDLLKLGGALKLKSLTDIKMDGKVSPHLSPRLLRKKGSTTFLNVIKKPTSKPVEKNFLMRSKSASNVFSIKNRLEDNRRHTISGDDTAKNDYFVNQMDDFVDVPQPDGSKETKYDSMSMGFGRDPINISDDEVYEILRDEANSLNNIEVGDLGDIKSGTMRALMRRLASDLVDTDSVDAFLFTYDLFIDHISLLRTLILMYRAPSGVDDTIDGNEDINKSKDVIIMQKSRKEFIIQFRIIKLLTQWITLRYESIKANAELINLYNRFIEYILSSEKMSKYAEQLTQVWKNMKRKRNITKRNLHVSKPARLHNFVKTVFSTPTIIPPMTLAQQLTVMDQNEFGRIDINEYRNLNFNKKSKKWAPNLKYMVKRFNKVSFWVATSIVSRSSCYSSGQRGQIISYFIKVMDCLRQLQSFNSLLQIYSALNMISVSRLAKAWNYVPPKLMTILTDISKLFELNYKEYRKILEVTEPPCIPIQEIILRDLTFIEESPSLFDNNWINFEKMMLIGKTLKLVKKFQSVQYELISNNEIYEWIASYDSMNADELFDESLIIEPSDVLKLKAKEEKKKEKKERKLNEYNRVKTKKRNAEIRKSGALKREWLPTIFDLEDENVQYKKKSKKDIIDRILFETNLLYKIIDHRDAEVNSKLSVEYCCVWNRTPYFESTWDTAINIDDVNKLEDYLDRCNRNYSKTSRFLSKTKRPDFDEKMMITSSFLSGNVLKDHHLASVHWLFYSWCKSLNCILADESGLGKMIQVITFLGLLQFKLNITGPFLIVVPFSRLIKWEFEFSRNLPNMNVFVYEGDDKSREFLLNHALFRSDNQSHKFNTIITSYDTMSKDYEHFTSIKWNALVIDHIEKNKSYTSSPYEPINKLKCPSKIMVTNNPSYNSQKEVWQVLNFFNAKTYPNYGSFEQKASAETAINGLKSRVLRRLKKDIESSQLESNSIFADYEKFCDTVDNDWKTLDFEDKSDQNTRKIVLTASLIFAKHFSRTSDKCLQFDEISVQALKNGLKIPKSIPSTLFDELYREAKVNIVSRVLKKSQ